MMTPYRNEKSLGVRTASEAHQRFGALVTAT